MSSPGADIFNTVMLQANDILLNKFYVPIGGSFQGVAELLVVLFVTLVGVSYMIGKTHQVAQRLLMAVIFLPICSTISFSHDATMFREWIYSPVVDASLGLTQMVLTLATGNQGLFGVFEALDDGFLKLGAAMLSRTEELDFYDSVYLPTLVAYGALLIGYGALYAVFLAALLVSYVALHVLLAPAGIMIFLAAIPFTRHLFFSWLRAVVSFALTPVMAALTIGFCLVFIDNAVRDIGAKGADASIFNAQLGVAYLTVFIGLVLVKKAGELASYITGGSMTSMGGLGASMMTAGGAAMATGTGARERLVSGAKGGIQGWQGGAGTFGRPYSALVGILKGPKQS